MSWLYVTAFHKANAEQKRLLVESYGKRDAELVNIVKGIYRDLDVEGEWINHVRTEVKDIEELIDQLPEKSPKQAYNIALQKFRTNYLDVETP